MAGNKDRFTKQSFEAYTIEVDASGSLDAGDAIQSSNLTVKVFDAQGVDVSAAMVAPGTVVAIGRSMFARIQAGADGQEYKVEFRATSDNGEKVEKDIKLIVRDI